jgi:hypothetical protein
MPRVFVAVGLDGTSPGATDTRARIKSEWIAIADSAGVFTADIVGIETITKRCSGK